MTLRTKILPAPVAPATLPRAPLQARLDQALSRRVTTVIAGAGRILVLSVIVNGPPAAHSIARSSAP